jgi:hypothetical protein
LHATGWTLPVLARSPGGHKILESGKFVLLSPARFGDLRLVVSPPLEIQGSGALQGTQRLTHHDPSFA